MTKTLTLLRHLKSDWGNPDLSDRERPLNRRGRDDGPRVAEAIVRHCPRPDLILCSSAVRTRATAAYIQQQFPDCPLHLEDRIYEAPATALLRLLSALKTPATDLMLIGHNSGLLDLAWRFVPKADPELPIFRKFPTGSVLSLELAISDWAEIAEAKATILTALTPKGLKAMDQKA